MNNLTRAIALIDFNPRLAACVDVLNNTKTPPQTIKGIVDAISTTRGVTLYKESI